jgi:hypothetical protein
MQAACSARLVWTGLAVSRRREKSPLIHLPNGRRLVSLFIWFPRTLFLFLVLFLSLSLYLSRLKSFVLLLSFRLLSLASLCFSLMRMATPCDSASVVFQSRSPIPFYNCPRMELSRFFPIQTLISWKHNFAISISLWHFLPVCVIRTLRALLASGNSSS